jgi:hypothetical protein
MVIRARHVPRIRIAGGAVVDPTQSLEDRFNAS